MLVFLGIEITLSTFSPYTAWYVVVPRAGLNGRWETSAGLATAGESHRNSLSNSTGRRKSGVLFHSHPRW